MLETEYSEQNNKKLFLINTYKIQEIASKYYEIIL